MAGNLHSILLLQYWVPRRKFHPLPQPDSSIGQCNLLHIHNNDIEFKSTHDYGNADAQSRLPLPSTGSGCSSENGLRDSGKVSGHPWRIIMCYNSIEVIRDIVLKELHQSDLHEGSCVHWCALCMEDGGVAIIIHMYTKRGKTLRGKGETHIDVQKVMCMQ